MQSMPEEKKSSQIFSVIQNPPSAFSPLTITKSNEKFLLISGICLITASLAERPTTSPKNKILKSFSP